MNINVENIFGLLFGLAALAAVMPLINAAITTLEPHVGPVSQLMLRLVIPLVLAGLVFSATGNDRGGAI